MPASALDLARSPPYLRNRPGRAWRAGRRRKVLNHVSGTTGGLVAVYQRHTYEKEIREAMDAWEDYLTKLCRQTRNVERISDRLLQNVA